MSQVTSHSRSCGKVQLPPAGWHSTSYESQKCISFIIQKETDFGRQILGKNAIRLGP